MQNLCFTYDDAVDYIHSFGKFGSVLGLDRIEKLLNMLDNPHKKLKFIHVAGTNGKGTTTMMCSNILCEQGYKVGTYISPYVSNFRERFQINLEMISEEEFIQLVEMIRPHVAKMNDDGDIVTEFEVITTIAFLYFQRHNCDIVCLEVGLGGNYDATNIIDTPLVGVITSISMDHISILGDTIEKIAAEKAGIIKQNTTVVTYAKQDESALAVLYEKCAKTASQLIKPNANAVEITHSGIDGNSFKYSGEEYEITMGLEHHVYNAVTAIEVMRQLSAQGYKVSENSIKNGLKNTRFIARFEILSNTPLIIVDGAHNYEGVSSLAHSIKHIKADKKVVIMGMLADKDYEKSLKSICNVVNKIICVPVNNPRGLEAKLLCETAKKFIGDADYSDDIDTAYDLAKNALDENDMLVICGSLYMVGDMRKVIIRNLTEIK